MMKFVSTFFLVFILAACSGQTPQPGLTQPPDVKATQPSELQTAYPGGAPTQPPLPSSYPAPQDTTPIAAVAPRVTADASKGTVTGKLLKNGVAVENVSLYLAKILKSLDGKELSLVIDKTVSPHAITDSTGKFVFQNVPPETYGFIVDTAVQTYALSKPGTNDQIRVTVTSGQAVDLGSMDYPDLPLD